jgi:sugar/nucleoside kinase (ribokinase family)
MNTRPQTGTLYIAGNVNVDLILGPLAQWPRIGTETTLPHSEMRVGGQAGNTGLALAALGARYRIVANMGDDTLGTWLRGSFPQSAPRWSPSSAPATLTVGIVHADGERTFFTTVGHLAEFAPEDVLDQLPTRAEPGDLVLVCGVFLSPLLVAGGRRLFETLKRREFVTALDVGWPNEGWDSVRLAVESWLPLIDHVLFNEVETTAMAGCESLDSAMQWFYERLPSDATLVVKRGPNGAWAWRRTERVTCPAPTVEVIDTIGAGDAFNAGYLLGCATGRDLAASLRMGVITASTAISTSPRRFVPTPDSGARSAVTVDRHEK